MEPAIALGLFLVCAAIGASTEGGPPLACNLKAIAEDDRPRYRELMKRLRAAVSRPRELADGHTYELDATQITLIEVAEWMTFERLCCPFLVFGLELKPGGVTELTLRGPAGVKAILREELPGAAQ